MHLTRSQLRRSADVRAFLSRALDRIGVDPTDATSSGDGHYEFSNEAGARPGRQIVGQMFNRGFFRRVRD
jgi:hypothetical protein